MTTITDILINNNFIIHAFDWKEPFNRESMISVGIRINTIFVKQLANIGIVNGKIRFYSGNGYSASDQTKFFSTYNEDNDAEKFILDFEKFINSMRTDPYSTYGHLIKRLEDF